MAQLWIALNIFMTPFYLLLPHPLRSLDRRDLFVHRTRTVMVKSRLDRFPLLTLSFGIAFHLQLVLLQFFYAFVSSYNLALFLKLIEPKAPIWAYGC